MILTMLELQSRTKIMKTRKLGGMRNARSTGELAGWLSKASACCGGQIQSREVQRTVEVWRLVQVSKAVQDREGWGRLCRANESAGGAEDPGCAQPHVNMLKAGGGEADAEGRGKPPQMPLSRNGEEHR